jgi:hypothetical protein
MCGFARQPGASWRHRSQIPNHAYKFNGFSTPSLEKEKKPSCIPLRSTRQLVCASGDSHSNINGSAKYLK